MLFNMTSVFKIKHIFTITKYCNSIRSKDEKNILSENDNLLYFIQVKNMS